MRSRHWTSQKVQSASDMGKSLSNWIFTCPKIWSDWQIQRSDFLLYSGEPGGECRCMTAYNKRSATSNGHASRYLWWNTHPWFTSPHIPFISLLPFSTQRSCPHYLVSMLAGLHLRITCNLETHTHTHTPPYTGFLHTVHIHVNMHAAPLAKPWGTICQNIQRKLSEQISIYTSKWHDI